MMSCQLPCSLLCTQPEAASSRATPAAKPHLPAAPAPATPPLLLVLTTQVCIEGSLAVNDVQLAVRDAAKVLGQPDAGTGLKLAAGPSGSHFMLIEMAGGDDE